MNLGKNVFCAKVYASILALSVCLGIVACKQPTKQSAVAKGYLIKQPKHVPLFVDTQKRADTAGNDDCPKAEAEPVFKRDVYPAARFVMQSDKRTGIETLTLANGDQLTVKQSGCEYYVLTFSFLTTSFSADTTDIAYWGKAALSLMRGVENGLQTPLEINAALVKLADRLKSYETNGAEPLKLNDEVDFGGPDPRQYFTLNRVTKLSDQRYRVELSLSYGPI